MLTADVIVPAHDEPLIRRTMLSIARQELPPGLRLHARIVANGCTDDTVLRARATASELAGHQSVSFTVDDLPTASKTAALNHGVRNSDSEIVFTTDGDVIFSRGAFAGAFQAFEDPAVQMSGCGHDVIIHDHLRPQLIGQLYRHRQIRRELFGGSSWPHGPMMAVRRSLYEQVGPYDEKFMGAEDTKLLLQTVRLFGWSAVRLALGQVVCIIPAATEDEMIKQAARWRVNHDLLLEFYPELVAASSERGAKMAALVRAAEQDRARLVAVMAAENIPECVLDFDLYHLPQRIADAAQALAPVLRQRMGKWDPAASTKALVS